MQPLTENGQQLVDALLATATEVPAPSTSSGNDREGGGARDVALQLCLDAGDHLFHDNEQRAYVLVHDRGVARTLSVKSRQYALLITQRYYRAVGSGLPTAAKTEAIATLEGLAIFEGAEEPVFTRIGEHDGRVVLDLCDDHWRVVVIDKHGWEVSKESPVRFRRTRGMLPLPVPVPGGSISELRPFLNVQCELDFVLVCGFILCCFNPHGPFIILLVNGEQGSAKSTLCRLLRAIIDPNKASLRSEPKDNRDLAIAANNAWMIGLDNMSQIGERLSNALCRLATGGGFSTRELYTDSDEEIFDAKRPVLINGIGDVAERSDLLDRAIRLTLPTIPEDQRKTEKSIFPAFQQSLPGILGAFLDMVSAALRNIGSVKFDKLPRMADCAMWVTAGESASPWKQGSFVSALDDQRRDTDEFVVEASVVANAVRDWVEHRGDVEGTATVLLQMLTEFVPESTRKHPDWPKKPPAFGTSLREVSPNLRRLGIEVVYDRGKKRRTITIFQNKTNADLPSPLSPPSPTPVEPPPRPQKAGSIGKTGDSESTEGDSEGDGHDASIPF